MNEKMNENKRIGQSFFESINFERIQNKLFRSEASFSFKRFSDKYLDSPLHKETKLDPDKMYPIFQARIEVFYYEFCFYHLILYYTAFLYAMNTYLLDYLTEEKHQIFRSKNTVLGNSVISGFPVLNLAYKPSKEVSDSIKKLEIKNMEAFKIKAPSTSEYRNLTLNDLFLHYLDSKSLESFLSVNSFSFLNKKAKDGNSFELQLFELIDSQQNNQSFFKENVTNSAEFRTKSSSSGAGEYSFFSGLLFAGEISLTFFSMNYKMDDLVSILRNFNVYFFSNYVNLTRKLKDLYKLESNLDLSITFPYFKNSPYQNTCLFSYAYPPNCVPSFEEICLLVSVYGLSDHTEILSPGQAFIEVIVLEGYTPPKTLPPLPNGCKSIIDYYGCGPNQKEEFQRYKKKTEELFNFRQKLGLLSNFSDSGTYKNPFCSGKIPKLDFFSVHDFVRSLACIQSLPLDVLNQYNLHKNLTKDYPVGINTFSFFNIYFLDVSVYHWFIFSSFYCSNTSKNEMISKLESFEGFPYNFNAYGTYSTRNNFSERLSLLRKKKQRLLLLPKNRLINKFKNNLRALVRFSLKPPLKLKNRGTVAVSFLNSYAKKKGHKTKEFVCFVGYADKNQIHLISKKKNNLRVKTSAVLPLKNRVAAAAVSFLNGYVIKKGQPTKQFVFSLGYVEKQQIQKIKRQLDKWVKKFNPSEFDKKTRLVPRKQYNQLSLLPIISPIFKDKVVQYQDVLFEEWNAQAKVYLEKKPNLRSQHPLRRYIFRWTKSSQCVKFHDHERIKTLLKVEGVREYMFQWEKNPKTGIFHYQGYFRFDQDHSQRPYQILSHLRGSLDKIQIIPFPKGVSIKSIRSYCSKKEIRAAGPFIYPATLI